MIQFLITIIISVLSATGILGIGTRAILSRMQKQDSRQKALEYGVQALLRDRMLHCYNKYIEAGFAPIYAKENYENMYRQYHELGGNGVMTQLHEELWHCRPRRKEHNMRNWKLWTKAAAVRDVKTMAQTAVATIGVAMTMQDVNWVIVGSTALLAGVLSVLTSIAGLPELKGEE